MKRTALWLLGGLLLAGTAQAQSGQAGSGQVQAIRPSGADNLSRHLSRLASNPRDVQALIGAGEAAVDMDDTRAAAGFFSRADAIQPNNARVKAGLGRVMLKTQNPAEALRLFDQAAQLGFGEATLLADRGLARDMTGDQAGAQRDYQAALKRAPDDAELIYRYAASLGISGQVDAAEKVLQPLLYKSDRAAWRYRAFILAMNNRQDDARKIASQTMPAQLAAAITPYMQKMPYLTAAQKAAAVHFGHFPTHVGTSIAAVTPTLPAGPVAAPTPLARTPSAPTQLPASGARAIPAQTPGRTTIAAASPARPTAASPATSLQTRPPATSPAVPSPRPARAAAAPATAAPASARVQGPPAPGFETVPSQRPAASAEASTAASQLNAISLAQASAPAAAPAPTPTPVAPAAAPRPQPNPEATRTLADIIRAIDVPDAERQASVAAVDLAEIEAMQNARRAERQAAADKAKKAAAAKAKAEADAKAKKAAEEKARLAANPSRNWVQVGTGADKAALAFTLRGLRRKYDDIAPQDGWVANWGRTNRLLIGPFASFTRAKTVESKLKSAGADVFAWQSDAGEVVERIGGK
ncbi:MAG TPA: tetratricopeptide repeat protein [Sphingobium sp.]|nr:tetratricopeptide repeat protein [Sphingobium sp.]